MNLTNDEDLNFDHTHSEACEQNSPVKGSTRPSESPYINPDGPSITSKWSELGGGYFKASGKTQDILPAGVYRVGVNQQGEVVYAKVTIIADELVSLPDSASERVIKSIETFWAAKERFAAKKQIFKRGILLWGPPGSGKSALIVQLIRELISKDGIVIYSSIPSLAEAALTQLRKVEPERHLICVLEDIDEIVTAYGEHALLSLLDGDTQIKNVVFIATTNYPDRLAKRIINRPSRFDEVVKIGMPSAASREMYLRSKFTTEELSDESLVKWVADTDNFSIAHLKELTICVYCLGRDYKETIDRLRKMEKALNASEGRQVGFNGN